MPLPFAAAEADHRENCDLLRRIAEALELSMRARDLLIWVANIERETKKPLRRTYEELGERKRGLACSRATAVRVISELKAAGLLEVKVVATCAGRKPNEYSIDWDGVRSVLDQLRQAASHRLKSEEPSAHFEPSHRLILNKPSAQNEAHIKEIHSLIPTPSKYPTTTTTAALASQEIPSSSSPDCDYEIDPLPPAAGENAVTLIAQCGVRTAADCARRARERGDDIRAIVTAWRSRAKGWEPRWAVHKLIDRLRNGAPGCGPDEGWEPPDFPDLLPPPPPRAKPPPSWSVASAGEPLRQLLARLNPRYGPCIDAMTAEQRVALLENHPQKEFLAPMAARGNGGGARPELLKILELREHENNAEAADQVGPEGVSACESTTRDRAIDRYNQNSCSDKSGRGNLADRRGSSNAWRACEVGK